MLSEMRFHIAFVILSVGVCLSQVNSEGDNCKVCSENLKKEIQSYKPIVDGIIEEIVHGQFQGQTYNDLLKFTDKFGHRLAGSESLEKSIDYLVDNFKKSGLENVHTEDVVIDKWQRGVEYAEVLSPYKAELKILGYGNTIGTPKEGLKAPAIVVRSFEEFDKLSEDKVKGKIVVYAQEWKGYYETEIYRRLGANVAAKKGALATLVRSITPFSIGTLHTDSVIYEDGIQKIPSAAISVENAMRLLRIFEQGEEIVINIKMDDGIVGKATTRNTFGELSGTSNKNTSVVVLCGHIDSWDVGVGALDDGGGSFVSWKATEFLKKMNLRPKRSIRTILWTAEEFRFLGAYSYANRHNQTLEDEFNIVIESDSGTFKPLGMKFTVNSEAECIMREILKLMKPLTATEYSSPAETATDIEVFRERGIPVGSLATNDDNYLWFYHSEGDSISIYNKTEMDMCTAFFAAVAYVIADLSVDIPRG